MAAIVFAGAAMTSLLLAQAPAPAPQGQAPAGQPPTEQGRGDPGRGAGPGGGRQGGRGGRAGGFTQFTRELAPQDVIVRGKSLYEANCVTCHAPDLRGTGKGANLLRSGIALSDQRCMEGLARTKLPGRMEVINQTPKIIVDGAHNAASIDAMMRAIGQHVPYDSMVVIFGCCADKDVAGMLERITSGADKVIFTKVNNIRTADPEELAARYVEQYGKMAQVANTLEDALAIANRAVTKEDLICITGSFYLVGEAKKLFASQQA